MSLLPRPARLSSRKQYAKYDDWTVLSWSRWVACIATPKQAKPAFLQSYKNMAQMWRSNDFANLQRHLERFARSSSAYCVAAVNQREANRWNLHAVGLQSCSLQGAIC